MYVLMSDFTTTQYLVVGVGSLFILTPYFFRLARSIWINFFVKYDPNAIEKWQNSEEKKLYEEAQKKKQDEKKAD
jgi:hypothetical protein